MQYVFFWVFPRRLSANSRRFGTLYQFHLQRQVYEVYFIDLSLKMEPIQCTETSAISTQTPGKHPKENILHLTHGESLKSRRYCLTEKLCVWLCSYWSIIHLKNTTGSYLSTEHIAERTVTTNEADPRKWRHTKSSIRHVRSPQYVWKPWHS
jgi:hypothetical protein